MSSTVLPQPSAWPVDQCGRETPVLSWDEPGHRGRGPSRGAGSGTAALSFRRGREGPELDLVEQFVACFPYRAPAGCRLTIFLEPRLSSGFPDAVAVVWDPVAARRWRDERAELHAADLRVMQLLVGAGATTAGDLAALAGRSLASEVERLHVAGLVVEDRQGRWRARPLRQVFAVRDIIAVEAKLSEWTGVVDQATRNTWFASRSYVLLPHLPKRHDLLRRAAAHGVGVWTLGTGAPVRALGARRGPMPRSYASWLFNEWVWRAAHGDLAHGDLARPCVMATDVPMSVASCLHRGPRTTSATCRDTTCRDTTCRDASGTDVGAPPSAAQHGVS